MAAREPAPAVPGARRLRAPQGRRFRGRASTISEQTEQTLDLWTGTLSSRFTLEDAHVRVESWVHPQRDLLAVRVDPGALPIESAGRAGRLSIRARDAHRRSVRLDAAGSQPDRPSRAGVRTGSNGTGRSTRRRIRCALGWAGPARVDDGKAHEWLLSLDRAGRPLEFVISFLGEAGAASCRTWPRRDRRARGTGRCSGSRAARSISPGAPIRARASWSGASCSRSTSRRSKCAGSLPPQETGLTFNSWFGKSHLEMHWWHAAHFALWNRRASCSSAACRGIAASCRRARETRARQGYRGARWPKMVGPDGRESPSGDRRLPDLAAAASDLSGGARVSALARTARCSSAIGTSCSRRRSSWRRIRAGTRRAALRARPAAHSGAGEPSARGRRSTRRSSWRTGRSGSRRRSGGASGSAWRASRRGTAC